MAQFEEFIRDLIEASLEKIEMSFPAEIISFDKINMEATIRPLLFTKTRVNADKVVTRPLPDMKTVPVEFIHCGTAYIRPDYKKGDLVSVRCYGSSVSQPREGQRSNTGLNRFQLSYCSVSSGLPPKNFTAPAAFSKPGLVIGDGAISIAFDSTAVLVDGDLEVDGNISVTGNVIVDGDVDATGDVMAGPPGARVRLLSHVHPPDNTPPTPVP
jgi:hypothetical protein